jgi:hypothetical protein
MSRSVLKKSHSKNSFKSPDGNNDGNQRRTLEFSGENGELGLSPSDYDATPRGKKSSSKSGQRKGGPQSSSSAIIEYEATFARLSVPKLERANPCNASSSTLASARSDTMDSISDTPQGADNVMEMVTRKRSGKKKSHKSSSREKATIEVVVSQPQTLANFIAGGPRKLLLKCEVQKVQTSGGGISHPRNIWT